MSHKKSIQSSCRKHSIPLHTLRSYCVALYNMLYFVAPNRNFVALPTSTDHKPTREDEHKRIRDAGGFVINNRVMGELAVSRAFGDCEFKKGIQVNYLL
jgi:hypothetical protein